MASEISNEYTCKCVDHALMITEPQGNQGCNDLFNVRMCAPRFDWCACILSLDNLIFHQTITQDWTELCICSQFKVHLVTFI